MLRIALGKVGDWNLPPSIQINFLQKVKVFQSLQRRHRRAHWKGIIRKPCTIARNRNMHLINRWT